MSRILENRSWQQNKTLGKINGSGCYLCRALRQEATKEHRIALTFCSVCEKTWHSRGAKASENSRFIPQKTWQEQTLPIDLTPKRKHTNERTGR